MGNINWFAVFAAAFSAFVIGGIWYSPLLFQGPWMRANGFSDADLARGGGAGMLAGTLALCLVMSASLAAFLDAPDRTAGWGALAGMLAGAPWVAPSIATVALFERRPAVYTFVNSGYWIVAFLVMGIILAAGGN